MPETKNNPAKTAGSFFSRNKAMFAVMGIAATAALLTGVGVAATLVFMPAALPAVLGFSILGVSIFAKMAAFSVPAQIAIFTGMGAGLAAMATSSLAALPSLGRFISSLFSRSSKAEAPVSAEVNNNAPDKAQTSEVSFSIKKMGRGSPETEAENAVSAKDSSVSVSPNGSAPASPAGAAPASPAGSAPASPAGPAPASPAGSAPASPAKSTPASPQEDDQAENEQDTVQSPRMAG